MVISQRIGIMNVLKICLELPLKKQQNFLTLEGNVSSLFHWDEFVSNNEICHFVGQKYGLSMNVELIYYFLYIQTMGGLDINWFRAEKGYDPNIIRKSLERRFRDPKLVDVIIEKDQQWRKIRYQLDSLKKEWNDIGKIIRDKKKANKEDPCAEQIKLKNENEEKQKGVEENEKALLVKIDQLVNSVGNIVHDSVPVFNDEEKNEVITTWGEIPKIKITDKRGGLNHHKVLQALGGYDPERGQKVAGHRGYFLKGVGVLLNNALINYGITFLSKRGYDLVQPPFFLKKEIMAETCQLSDFDDQLYKVSGNTEDEDFYLIATSEQPISAMHRGEWIDESSLPIKYGGSSSCFRKEAGAHGKDTWGIFRVHQFEKIEQFCITKPEDSWQMLEDMIHLSEEFYRSLKLPYRVISIVSGALNDAAAKKYDLEAWFPGYESYRELVSCSNCTDFQSRNLGIRCGSKKKDDAEKRYVHMLNGTLCATERTLCCILENYQEENGLRVPEVLQPILGTDFLPYKEEEKPKEKKKEEKPKEGKKKEQKKEKKEEIKAEVKAQEEVKVEVAAEAEPAKTE